MKLGTIAAIAAGLTVAANAAEMPRKIICLGDSITGQPNLKCYLKFNSILECMLEARAGARTTAVINRGIGGDRTPGALARLENDVIAEKPDITIVLLGGNDANTGMSQEETRKNLTAIVERLKAAKSKVLLLQYHVIPNPGNPETAWVKLAGNNALIAEIGKRQDVPVLDLAEPMRRAWQEATTSELISRDAAGVAVWKPVKMTQEHLVNAQDGVHLNPGGELVFARAIFDKLLALHWIP